jgi:hypothetical protein
VVTSGDQCGGRHVSDANESGGAAGSAWLWLAGLGGALVSLAHMGNLSRRQKAGAVLAGTLTAGFLGPYVSEQLAAGPRGAAALHFCLGLGGLVLSGGLVALFQAFRDNPAATLGELLRRVAGGKGG